MAARVSNLKPNAHIILISLKWPLRKTFSEGFRLRKVSNVAAIDLEQLNNKSSNRIKFQNQHTLMLFAITHFASVPPTKITTRIELFFVCQRGLS